MADPKPARRPHGRLFALTMAAVAVLSVAYALATPGRRGSHAESRKR